MIKIDLFDKFKRNTEATLDTVAKIKSGDTVLKEKFIADYRPFIIKAVSRTSKRYINIENSDEYSIGLIAFNEAIDCYDSSKNRNFFNFAGQVIKRRIIDYIRSNYKNKNVYPFTSFENDENKGFEEKYLIDDSVSQFDKIELQEEIISFNKRLGEFNISLEDLVECAPKHSDSKQLCIKIARVIADNEELIEKLIRKKNIPMVDLMKRVNVNQRTIERNRKFIIAVCLILNSRFDDLKQYVRNAERGGEACGI